MRVAFDGVERYPIYVAVTETDIIAGHHMVEFDRFEVSESDLGRWREAERAFEAAQLEIRDVIDPRCECGHRRIRHHKSVDPRMWRDGCGIGSCRCPRTPADIPVPRRVKS